MTPLGSEQTTGSLVVMILDGLSFAFGQLCEGRTLFVVLDDVIIEDVAVMAGHLQGRVSHDLLKGEHIAAAVHQILPSEGVSERMDRSPFHAAAVVVLHDSEPQGVLSQETTKLIAEQVVGRFALSDCHVIPQNGHRRRAEGNDLNFTILREPENNLPAARIYILILIIANCGSPTPAVQKEVHPILTELAIGFRLP